MGAAHRLRTYVYDTAIVPLTSDWYRQVIEGLAADCHLLDIGIGTGTALLANAAELRRKNIRVTGVDIDADYMARCRRGVEAAAIADLVEVRLESIYDHRGGPYDAAYFSASFMLMPDPVAALRHVSTLLRPGALFYFTQTFEHRRSPVLGFIKPLLRWLTTIDFGRVTYEDEFRRTLAAGDLEIDSRHTLHAGRRRSGVLIIARPR